MKPLTLHVAGRRVVRREARALFLDGGAPEQPLRLALIVRGTEQHVFPALALDDWGREKTGLGLYRWLYEEGPRFPRAELFGFDANGDKTQIFLRDLELSFAYPAFLYASAGDSVEQGHRLNAIFLPGDEGPTSPVKIDSPPNLPWPLRRAAVRWRQASLRTLRESGWREFSGAGE